MIQTNTAIDEQAAVVKDSLAWLLPDPVALQECVVIRKWRDLVRQDQRPAVCLIGRMGQRVDRFPELGRLIAKYNFRLVPPTVHPRAMLPVGSERTQFMALLQPRTQAASPVKRLAAAAIPRIPNLTRLISAPVQLATTGTSEVLQLLHQEVAGSSLGISIGNQFSRGRTIIRAVDGRAGTIAITKFVVHEDGRDQLGTQHLAHEYEVLTALRGYPKILGSVPLVLGYVPGHLGDALITDAFNGQPAPTTVTPAMYAWLDRCLVGGDVAIRDTALVRQLIDQTFGQCDDDGLMTAAVSRAVENIGLHRVPRVVVHGDFVPWNMILVDSEVKVFDWEYAFLDGIPGWDQAFFHLRLGYVFSSWSVGRIITEVEELARKPPHYYDPISYRSVLLLLLVHIVIRDQLEQRCSRARPVRQAIEQLLAMGWIG